MPINVSRHIKIETATFRVRVLTPMFLGGAEGNAELRAAPFRNLLRSWWRVTQGPSNNLFDREKKLFGGVHGGDAVTSHVKVQVIGLENRELPIIAVGTNINIGQMHNREAGGRPEVSRAAYLGMGPVHFNGNLNKSAINPGAEFDLIVRYPVSEQALFQDIMSLVHHFGALGSRSRRGWGSFSLINENYNFKTFGELHQKFGKNLEQIFQSSLQYPFCLGLNGKKIFIWQLRNAGNWQQNLGLISEIYMHLKHEVNIAPTGAQDRHVLGMPLTGKAHAIHGIDRMPSQIRIINKPSEEGNNLVTYIMHIPHKMSADLRFDDARQLGVWNSVHQFLDNQPLLTRVEI